MYWELSLPRLWKIVLLNIAELEVGGFQSDYVWSSPFFWMWCDLVSHQSTNISEDILSPSEGAEEDGRSFCCALLCSTWLTVLTCTFDTLVNWYQTTCNHEQEDGKLQTCSGLPLLFKCITTKKSTIWHSVSWLIQMWGEILVISK
jgi:hypothetical protein